MLYRPVTVQRQVDEKKSERIKYKIIDFLHLYWCWFCLEGSTKMLVDHVFAELDPLTEPPLLPFGYFAMWF